MHKITKYHLIGYIFILFGVVLGIINCMMNNPSEKIFGNVYLYVCSGIIVAAGLTLVFNEKIDKKEENVTSNKD